LRYSTERAHKHLCADFCWWVFVVVYFWVVGNFVWSCVELCGRCSNFTAIYMAALKILLVGLLVVVLFVVQTKCQPTVTSYTMQYFGENGIKGITYSDPAKKRIRDDDLVAATASITLDNDQTQVAFPLNLKTCNISCYQGEVCSDPSNSCDTLRFDSFEYLQYAQRTGQCPNGDDEWTYHHPGVITVNYCFSPSNIPTSVIVYGVENYLFNITSWNTAVPDAKKFIIPSICTCGDTNLIK